MMLNNNYEAQYLGGENTSGSQSSPYDERVHQCPQCPKRFNRPSSLRIHVNTHTGEKRTSMLH